MKLKIKYKIAATTEKQSNNKVFVFWGFLLMFFIFQKLGAQTVPWTAPQLTVKHASVTISCIPLVNGLSLSNGDYIGVFNKVGYCHGLVKYIDSTTVINISGTNSNGGELKNEEHIYFKVWLHNEDCIIDSVTEIVSESPLIYSDTIKNRVNVLNFQKATIYYPTNEYCLNANNIAPIGNYFPSDVFFTSTSGLNINSSNGIVEPSQSKAGTYTINIKSGYCLVNKNLRLTLNDIPRLPEIPDTFICGDKLTLSIPVNSDSILWYDGYSLQERVFTEPAKVSYTLTNVKGCRNTGVINIYKMAISKVDYTIDKADCYQKGKLKLIEQVITNGKPPYTYRLISQLDNNVLTNIDDVPEGIYKMEIINNNGCALKYQRNIIVDKDCLNDKPVFTPNEDGKDDRYFINLEGEIRIYDRNGSFRRKLVGPCYFDGLDTNGRKLPMGTYLVVSQHGKQITLTIIR